MSNRLSTVDWVPLVRDDAPESRGSAIRESRSRAEYVMQLGRHVGEVLRAIAGAFAWVDRRVDEATAMRELAMMNDRMLADIGLKRSDIPLIGSERTAPQAHAA